MKKLLSIFTVLFLSLSAFAQIPEKKSVALVTKQTGCWCYYCGDWGWPMGHGLYDSTQTTGKGIFMAVYDNSQGIYGPVNLVNPSDGTFNQNYPTSGVPNFMVNNVSVDLAVTNTDALIKEFLYHRIDSVAATTPIVSSAANYEISGNTITSTGKARFWSSASGDYYMGSYIVEDSVLAGQNPLTTGSQTVAHVGVLRASMTATGFWGEQIGTGTIAADNEVSKAYTATLDAGWNVNHLRVFTAIWKKNGNKYEFVNAAVSQGSTTSVRELTNAQDVMLFPNPASGSSTLSFFAKNSMTLSVNVTDVTGRSVYTSANLPITQGANSIIIPTERLSNGMYHVMLSSGDGKMTKSLSVVK